VTGAAAALAFERAFLARAPRFALRAERPDDAPFLDELFARCSPLAELVPPAMLAQQAAMQRAGHRGEHPGASWWIVTRHGAPVGRAGIDWSLAGTARFVDLAMLPDAREGAAGLHLLRAWTAVADACGLRADLMVARGNPAIALYRRLGFADAPGGDPHAPMVAMTRAPR
jgi:N-acetylglutamate synthase-like GNAT family acetyltransferase